MCSRGRRRSLALSSFSDAAPRGGSEARDSRFNATATARVVARLTSQSPLRDLAQPLFRCMWQEVCFFSFFVHFLLSLHCDTPLAARTSDSHHNKPKKFSSSRHEAQCRTLYPHGRCPSRRRQTRSHNTTRSKFSRAQSCSALPAHIVAIDNGRFACCCRSVRRARAARSHRLGL